jgi:hypothetical protein
MRADSGGGNCIIDMRRPWVLTQGRRISILTAGSKPEKAL